MEVRIISKEIVKPSSPEVYLRKPFSLSLLDQLTPAHYVPFVVFYNKPDNSRFNNTAQILAMLKESVRKALNQFYPLSGRTIDNCYISSYDKGVPYVEASVEAALADFIAQTEVELSKQLLPCQCFCSIPTSTSPQMVIQVTVFGCGGVAIALCGSHKINDATSASAFVKTWAAFNRGSDGGIRYPDMLDAGSRLFPPLESIPQDHLSLTEALYLTEGWHTSKTFLFQNDAIAALKLKAKSKTLEHPTRNVALSAFLWKHAMLASSAASGRWRPTVLSNSMNLRPRMKPSLPEHAIGNLRWFAVSTYNPSATDIELDQLAHLVSKASDISKDQISRLQSGDALEVMTELLSQMADFALQGDVEFFHCNSWLNTLGGDGVDFGWGQPMTSRPVWREARYYSYANNFFLKSAENGKAIEAVITLDAKAMEILEHDPGFLAFASPTSSLFSGAVSKI
ncbi:hypothetical protein like AT3G26040 [Hibiscus trionum]|uniref:Uncharacterized protein n=1 Tax=Hibiscus trionum TaxID=183268 RepID=A0A9W7MV27_HIBTR|nr:hypothetical protein like AT3G26040 [Hibiscus trionum]